MTVEKYRKMKFTFENFDRHRTTRINEKGRGSREKLEILRIYSNICCISQKDHLTPSKRTLLVERHGRYSWSCRGLNQQIFEASELDEIAIEVCNENFSLL